MHPSVPRRLRALFSTQVLLALGLYAFCLYGFVKFTGRQGDTFSDLARERYLGTVLWYQLRVLPAYLVLALAATLMAWPWLQRRPCLVAVATPRASRPPGRHRLRLLALTFVVNLGLIVLSLGIFYQLNPGLLDGLVRKSSPVAPGIDWYALIRWHVLDAVAVLFCLAALWSVLSLGRAWVIGLNRRGGALRLAGLALPLLGLGALLWATLRTPRPPPPPADTPPNVLIIAADSWRADRVGVHGYHRTDITPNIDAFAATAADFTRLHVSTASTLESWITTFSSRFPPAHGVRYMFLRSEQAQAASAMPDMLPKVLNDLGYYSAVVSDWAGNCFKLVDVGFTHNDASDTQNFTSFIMESTIWAHFMFPLYFSNQFGEWLIPEAARTTKYLRPTALIDRMLGHIDAAGAQGKPFFGVLFFSTTHLPYSARYPFNRKYTDPEYAGPHRYEIEVSVHDLITTGFNPDLPQDTIEHIRDLYDGAVNQFDHDVGQVLAALKARGLDERTIVIITSDHGDDLYDPGSTLGHGTNFFGGDQSTHIPFFVRAPGITRPGSRIDTLARNIDVAPTLLALLGKPAPASWRGVDLGPAIRGDVPDLELPIFGETCYLFFPKREAMQALAADERARLLDASGARNTLEVDDRFDDNIVVRAALHDLAIATKDRMVRTPRYKLLDIPVTEGPPIRRLWDMQADPGQTHDLSAAGLPVYDRLVALLAAYDRGEGEAARWPTAWDGSAPTPPLNGEHPPAGGALSDPPGAPEPATPAAVGASQPRDNTTLPSPITPEPAAPSP